MWPDAGSSVKTEQTTFTVNELSQRMSDPAQHHFSKLKRLVRCLNGERDAWIQVYEFGDMREVTVFSDSDWAGDKETTTWSSASIAPVGRHLLKAYTRKQKIIARSCAEAELYAAELKASEAKGVQNMMCDLGFAVKPVLIIDAKATEHILHRHGIGKIKHIDVAHLWLQDEITSNRLSVRCVKSDDNLADIGTKALSNKIIRKHATSMGYIDASRELEVRRCHGALEWKNRTMRSEQSNSAENVIGINWWPCQTAAGQQQRWRGQPSSTEGDQERPFCGAFLQKRVAVDGYSSSHVDFLTNWFVASMKFLG